MFYPSGETPKGRLVICMEDSKPEIDEATANCQDYCIVECLTEWLHENECCVEDWQMKEYLKNKGVGEDQMNEDMAAGAGAAPAPGLATLNTTAGMGNPQAPMNGGTNAGFYNSSLDGSGDKFPSLNVGTSAAGSSKRKKGERLVGSYLDFLKKKNKLSN